MRTAVRVLLAWLSVSSLGARAQAQGACDASCDVVVDAADREVDGAGIAPGDTVCIRGGEASTLSIHDVHGSDGSPITIRACDAPLRLGGGGSTNGLAIRRSSYLRVTGGDDHALVIFGGDGYSMGVSVADCTEHLEIDGLEVSGTSYTAYRDLSEVDSCAVRTGFSLHDWLIHDVGGEGMFFGSNAGTTPYRLVHVEVFHNRVERTGMQGIKIGHSVDDAHVFENVVLDAGTRDISGEDTGITGSATSWVIERNVIVRTSNSCMFVSGSDVHILDNVMAGCGGGAISMNGTGPSVRIVHNTIVAPDGGALNMWASMAMPSAFVNNLVVGLPDGARLGISASDTWTVEGNVTTTLAEAGFARTIDPATATYEELVPPPFALAEGSLAQDTGVANDDVTTDIVGTPRDESPDVGAYEIGAPPVDAGVIATPDAGSTSDAGVVASDAGARTDGSFATDAATVPPATTSGGCSVSHARGSLFTWCALSMIALIASGRRRTRSLRLRGA